jgi:hypothetical protein
MDDPALQRDIEIKQSGDKQPVTYVGYQHLLLAGKSMEKSVVIRRDLSKSADCLNRTRLDFRQYGNDSMPERVSPIRFACVCWILNRNQIEKSWDRSQVVAVFRDKRSPDSQCVRRLSALPPGNADRRQPGHSRRPLQPGSTHEVHQDRFGLVLGMMSKHQHVAASAFILQKKIAFTPSRFLNPDSRVELPDISLDIAHLERQLKRACERSRSDRILSRI